MCCGVVPILFGRFLRLPSLHALVFIRKTFLRAVSYIHLPNNLIIMILIKMTELLMVCGDYFTWSFIDLAKSLPPHSQSLGQCIAGQ